MSQASRLPTLSLWSDFASAGGQRLGGLEAPLGGSARYRIDGDTTATLGVSAVRWQKLGGTLGNVVRIDWPEGTIDEWRVQRVSDARTSPLPPVDVVQLALVPMWADLAERGPVLPVVGGAVTTRVAGALPLTTWLTQRVLAHEAAQRLGLVLGTVASDPVVDAEFDAAAPLAIAQQVVGQAGAELTFERVDDTQWRLQAPAARGAELPALVARPGVNVLAQLAGYDRAQLNTVVLPFGDADPATGDRATMAEVRYKVHGLPGDRWVQLRDADTDTSPILVDTQWVGAAVQLVDLSTRGIVDSRVSDGAVRLDSVTGLSVGSVVGLAMADGGPLVEVFDSTSLATGGRRVRPLTLAGRGEANRIANGGFADALTGWTTPNAPTPAAYAEVKRSELGVTRTFRAAGARSAGTTASTPFTVDGLAAGERIVRGDVITHVGGELALSSACIPNASGVLTVPLHYPLPSDFADGDVLPLVRREGGSYTLAALPKLGGILLCTGADANAVQRLTAFARVDGPPFLSTPGDVFVTGPGSEVFDGNLNALYPVPGASTQAAFRYGGFSGGSATPLGVFTCNLARAVGQQRVRLYQSAPPSGTLGTHVMCDFGGSFASTTSIIPAFCRNNPNTTNPAWRFLGIIDGSGYDADVGLDYIEADWVGVPAWADLRGEAGGIINYGSGPQVITTSDLWSGSATLDWRRETRSLVLDGAHPTGSTTLTTKPIPALARRDWLGTDTLYLPTLGLTLALTGAASWASTGLATVPVSVPSGVTIPAGTRCYSNWSGTSDADGYLVVANEVVGPASSVSVRGGDAYANTWDGLSAAPTALYRVDPLSIVRILGNTLRAAATATADGSGAASVTLEGPNVNTITDNATLVLSRPVMLRPTDPQDGSVVRCVTPVTAPTADAPALASSLARIPVPAGGTRPVTVFVTFSLSAGTYQASDLPWVVLIDDAGSIRASARLADTAVQVLTTPTLARVILTTTITSTQWLGARIIGGPASPTSWIVVTDAMLCTTARDDVPFTASSWGNPLAQRAAEALSLQRFPTADIQVSLATLRRWFDAAPTTPAVQLGQRLEFPALGVTRRVVEIDRPFTQPDRATVTVGTLPTALSRRVAALR
ncbi:MAG: hypothetical protein K2Y26_00235 [Gemmatimonadaceae bacterium]|nr:hypothetical protein [Gemmatimonadaceae bacterium]